MLAVKIYVLNAKAEEEVIGEYRLVDGKVQPSPADSLALQRILEGRPVGPDPVAWLRNLCNEVKGTYLYAGRAEEV